MTMYGELSSAETADHFEPIFRRLQQEWTFIGGLVRFFFSFVFEHNPTEDHPSSSLLLRRLLVDYKNMRL